jgi:chromosome segregation ATPase
MNINIRFNHLLPLHSSTSFEIPNMSFFTYYGKLKDELLVAILPNGTVEVDDPIHLFSQKQLISYRVRDVSVTEDGEDRITFHDGYYQFEAVTAKAYKAVSLTRKAISSGEKATVELTRHYDQAQTTTSTTDRPKIWTGAVSFHEWANNESFIVIAPRGLGNTKPVVALWQWTKDNKGTAKTLSYGVSKQTSDTASPEKFSFKQNDYYTLDCQVNATTKGLNVTVKAPTNPEKVQKELTLAPQSEARSEHRLAPPRARQEKVTLECSLPNAKPSLPRITGALPFPADLVETLSYSAAYVDQAGYLAKYAVKQFEKLDRSYHLLEKKADARAAKVIKLEGDVSRLTSENQSLTKRNADLEKKNAKDRADAAEREAGLEERLRKALAALKTAEDRAQRAEKENALLIKHIAKDKAEDIARELAHAEHDRADHKAIDLANEALRAAQHECKHLKERLARRDSTIAQLETKLDALQCRLDCAEAEVQRLDGALDAEKKLKAEVQTKLDEALHKLSVAEQDRAHLRTELANTKAELDAAQTKRAELEELVGETQRKLTKAEKKATDVGGELTTLKSLYKELKEENKEIRDRADVADSARGELSEQLNQARENHEAELAALEKKYKKSAVVAPGIKSDVKATVTEITT